MKRQHAFAHTLLQWYRENGRSLPWRETRDAYAIWLSEVILQQTRIQQGLDYWLRFMQRFPVVADLAAADEDEVLRLWQGLGYYSRARNLYAAAKQIVELGRFPETLEEIKRLKGVGDYTAAAIGSIAFGLPVAAVDGNVYRVLARYFGISTPINSTEGKKLFAAMAQDLLPSDQAATYNQAIMDFGAIQCTPQSPRCLLCPINETCEALRTGQVESLPVKLKTVKVTERQMSYVYLRWQGKTCIRRRGKGDIWQGLWEPPTLDVVQAVGLPTGKQLCKQVKHVLTHRVLYADFYFLEVDLQPQLPADYRWIEESDIDQYALPRLIEILFEAIDRR
ncbi:A/G-specific adenine glycosylase [Prevotella sp. DNF00663]|uniref:A/G-specific adenine glycosylase n=1 Tax=Prevotella sp. DNF00663 TaxID=1384078 RepID=UPI0007841A5D|nr:A/G-specific adenine glycosylase [Prevotella sp. DNF00663]KXB84761.1 A/G-specific adenine glycosylase [Prevotella sp. DNF00663]